MNLISPDPKQSYTAKTFEEKRVPLRRNRAKCLGCDEMVESASRHDYRSCSCGNLHVDGGLDYIKRSYGDKGWIELSEGWEDDPDLLFAKPA